MKKISNMEMENISGGILWRLTDGQILKLVKKGFVVTLQRAYDPNGNLVTGYSVVTFLRRAVSARKIFNILGNDRNVRFIVTNLDIDFILGNDNNLN